mmetsp:Transcript_7979/g.16334  ORF Transcript_7979/g.16334 Transcript_7979/m.16334 type:complete len:800 (-) Transcript_7979:301-2700(-)
MKSSISSASSVGSRVKRSHERRHSSKSSSTTSSYHDSDSVASLRSGSAFRSKASSRNRSVASHDTYSIESGSQKSKVSAASTKSHFSNDDDSVFPMRSSHSVSSRRSNRSTPSFQEQLESLSDRSHRSGSELAGSAARSSPRSVSSHASHKSNHSRRSHRSSSSRKSSMSNSHRSLASTNSHNSASVTSHKSTNSKRGEKTSSLQQKGETQLKSKRYSEAIKSFTSAIRACDSSQDWSGSDEDKATNGTDTTMAVLYRYRCEALYEIGLYELAAKDARKALKLEQSSTKSDHTNNGLALRGKILSLLGYSLLRIGNNNFESAKKAFEDSIEWTKDAIDNAKMLSSTGQPSTSLDDAKKLLKTTLEESKTGLNEIVTYETLKEELKDSSRKSYIMDLDSILDMTPGNIDLHVQKIKHLISRKRWFEVANHCEQMAAKASRYCGVGIFKGDLQDADPFPDMKLEELDPDYFTRRDKVVPQHLRVLPTVASREAVSLLPKEILSYYVTSLRLEDRCDSALVVGRFLRKKGDSVDNIEKEWQKLNDTIKLREEGNVFFRNGKFDRAASQYKQCLEVCSETNTGGQINAALHYNRGKCFYAMSQYQDASTEFTQAISIHSMYSDAILQRARCHLQMKDRKKASANFNRYLTLVEGTREHPYPPPYKGSNCFFDMPSDVTYRQVESVKAEMEKHRIADISSNQRHSNTQSGMSSFIEKSKAKLFSGLCNKKGVTNQVVVNKRPRQNGTELRITDGSNLRSSMNSNSSTPGTKFVRFLGDPPSHAPSMRSSNDPLRNEFDMKEREP